MNTEAPAPSRKQQEESIEREIGLIVADKGLAYLFALRHLASDIDFLHRARRRDINSPSEVISILRSNKRENRQDYLAASELATNALITMMTLNPTLTIESAIGQIYWQQRQQQREDLFFSIMLSQDFQLANGEAELKDAIAKLLLYPELSKIVHRQQISTFSALIAAVQQAPASLLPSKQRDLAWYKRPSTLEALVTMARVADDMLPDFWNTRSLGE